MKIKCPSNGLYSLKNSHKGFHPQPYMYIFVNIIIDLDFCGVKGALCKQNRTFGSKLGFIQSWTEVSWLLKHLSCSNFFWLSLIKIYLSLPSKELSDDFDCGCTMWTFCRVFTVCSAHTSQLPIPVTSTKKPA